MSHIVLLELVLVLVMSAGLGHGQFIQLSTADETSLNSTYLGTLLAGQPVPVTDLRLSNNQLTTIEQDSFEGLTNLTFLFLSGNQLMTIEADAFANLTLLSHLYLNSNQLTTIGTDMFASLTSLTVLSLFSNQLTIIAQSTFSSLISLTTLRLSNNHLTNIEEDAFSTNLITLLLNDNRLTNIDGNTFTSLSRLTTLLDNNMLTTIDQDAFISLTSLTLLDLSNNCLTTFPPAPIPPTLESGVQPCSTSSEISSTTTFVITLATSPTALVADESALPSLSSTPGKPVWPVVVGVVIALLLLVVVVATTVLHRRRITPTVMSMPSTVRDSGTMPMQRTPWSPHYYDHECNNEHIGDSAQVQTARDKTSCEVNIPDNAWDTATYNIDSNGPHSDRPWIEDCSSWAVLGARCGEYESVLTGGEYRSHDDYDSTLTTQRKTMQHQKCLSVLTDGRGAVCAGASCQSTSKECRVIPERDGGDATLHENLPTDGATLKTVDVARGASPGYQSMLTARSAGADADYGLALTTPRVAGGGADANYGLALTTPRVAGGTAYQSTLTFKDGKPAGDTSL